MTTSSGPAAAGADRGLGRDLWRVAVVVILSSAMSVLDTTIVNTASPRSDRTPPRRRSWWCRWRWPSASLPCSWFGRSGCRPPLLNLRLYANRSFSAAAVATLSLGGALMGGMIMLLFYFQLVRGESPAHTGMLLVPQGVGSAVAMWASGRLTDRLGAGATALAGGLTALVATLPLMAIGSQTSFVLLAGVMVARGFGIGLSMMPAMTAAFRVLSPAEVNDASPQLNVLQRLGASVGTAVLVVVLQHHLARAATPTARAGAFDAKFGWLVALYVVGIVPVLLLLRAERAAFASGSGGVLVATGADGTAGTAGALGTDATTVAEAGAAMEAL
ncbi:MAG: MFS transporter [Acidimicrobiales bacterium]